MFTIKLYAENYGRQVIKTAESFTILRTVDSGGWIAEITLHQKDPGLDSRVDVNAQPLPEGDTYSAPRFEKAIIENASGKTTEIINCRPPC